MTHLEGVLNEVDAKAGLKDIYSCQDLPILAAEIDKTF